MQYNNDARSINSQHPGILHAAASKPYSQTVPYGSVQYSPNLQVFGQPSTEAYHYAVNDPMGTMARTFGSLNFQAAGPTGPSKYSSNTTIAPVALSGINGTQGGGQVYYLPEGGLVVPTLPQGSYYQNSSNYKNYKILPNQAQYLQQGQSNGFSVPPNTPQAQIWASSSAPHKAPDFAVPRRNSWSSNEDNPSGTPFFGGPNGFDYQPGGSVVGQSPQTWTTTPSPTNPLPSSSSPQILAAPNGKYVYADLDALTQKDPAIPTAIPAPFSPGTGRGTLESSLVNEDGITNVYIRGLHPDTTDDMLYAYGVRFGEIKSCKAILELPTGMCKGFGFILYNSFVQGENCIRGFFHKGYEAKWARESHNSRLKTLADPNNTNLYISNLPEGMNEYTMGLIFTSHGYNIQSKKMLRDEKNGGKSRGVGFARFDSHEICEKVIEQFNGKPIGDDKNILQIRYADTQLQKQLKTTTTERRQFKTHEYNVAAFGPASPYHLSSPSSGGLPSPLQIRAPGSNGSWYNPSAVPQNFTNYMHSLAAYQNQGISAITGVKTKLENAPPPRGRSSTRVKVETGSAAIPIKNPSEPAKCVSTPDSPSFDVEECSITTINPSKAKIMPSPSKSAS